MEDAMARVYGPGAVDWKRRRRRRRRGFRGGRKRRWTHKKLPCKRRGHKSLRVAIGTLFEAAE